MHWVQPFIMVTFIFCIYFLLCYNSFLSPFFPIYVSCMAWNQLKVLFYQEGSLVSYIEFIAALWWFLFIAFMEPVIFSFLFYYSCIWKAWIKSCKIFFLLWHQYIIKVDREEKKYSGLNCKTCTCSKQTDLNKDVHVWMSKICVQHASCFFFLHLIKCTYTSAKKKKNKKM